MLTSKLIVLPFIAHSLCPHFVRLVRRTMPSWILLHSGKYSASLRCRFILPSLLRDSASLHPTQNPLTSFGFAPVGLRPTSHWYGSARSALLNANPFGLYTPMPSTSLIKCLRTKFIRFRFAPVEIKISTSLEYDFALSVRLHQSDVTSYIHFCPQLHSLSAQH